MLILGFQFKFHTLRGRGEGRGPHDKSEDNKEELAALIWNRCADANMDIRSVTVVPSSTSGWTANYLTKPELVLAYTTEFDAIVEEVRDVYDLAD
jgi:hypothetical protein